MNPRPITVVCDACVLINLLHCRQQRLLKVLHGFRFVVTTTVVAELKKEAEAKGLAELLQKDWITQVDLEHDQEHRLWHELRSNLDDGEAATLALAIHRRWCWATDDGMALEVGAMRLGREKTFGTQALLVAAIQQGHLDVDQADRIKAQLELRKFKLPFASFRDLL